MRRGPLVDELVRSLVTGERRALSRLITLVEQRNDKVNDISQSIYPYTGKGYCVGVSGPPGSGKSTIVDCLIKLARKEDKRVGVLAVDPTSPYTDGAVLGDRIRMQRHSLDSDVFIRSMATRGSHGGISKSVGLAVQLLDASGKEMLIVETVGVGQSEVDITTVADTVIVVLVPEAGDTVQTMKAGLLETADILVVNKSDREGAQRLVAALKGMIAMGSRDAGNAWRVPVIKTHASHEDGVEEVYTQIRRHREFLESSDQLEARRKERRRQSFVISLRDMLQDSLTEFLQGTGDLAMVTQAVERGEIDPMTAAQSVIDQLLSNKTLRSS